MAPIASDGGENAFTKWLMDTGLSTRSALSNERSSTVVVRQAKTEHRTRLRVSLGLDANARLVSGTGSNGGECLGRSRKRPASGGGGETRRIQRRETAGRPDAVFNPVVLLISPSNSPPLTRGEGLSQPRMRCGEANIRTSKVVESVLDSVPCT